MTRNEAPLMRQAPGASNHGGGQRAVYAADDSTLSSVASIKIPCLRCGVIDYHRVKPGDRPHGAKQLLVAALSAILEISPALAYVLGRIVLAAWPGFGRA